MDDYDCNVKVVEDKSIALQASLDACAEKLAQNRVELVQALNSMRRLKNAKIAKLECRIAQLDALHVSNQQQHTSAGVFVRCEALTEASINPPIGAIEISVSDKFGTSVGFAHPTDTSFNISSNDEANASESTATPGTNSVQSNQRLRNDNRISDVKTLGSACTTCQEKDVVIESLKRQLQYAHDGVKVYVRPYQEETPEYLGMLAREQTRLRNGVQHGFTGPCEVLLGVGLGLISAILTTRQWNEWDDFRMWKYT